MSAPQLENVADIYALSSMQEGMLFHTIAEPGTGVFVDQISIELGGDLDVGAFRGAWARVIARHTALRTAFLWDGLDEPLQIVREQVELSVEEGDWSDLSPEQLRARLDTLLEEDRQHGFDLSEAPLMRMHLIRTEARCWRWVWSFHHLIADGWSAQLLLDEFLKVYESGQTGVELQLPEPFAYRDFIAWHASRDEGEAERYWRERLAGFSSPHRLEAPGGTGSTAEGYDSLRLVLSQDVSRTLAAMAAEQRVTLNTAVSGAWALLLSRWMREADVVFGVTNAGRPLELDGVERAVGLFINTLPSRAEVRAEARLGDWLRELQKQQLADRDHDSSSLRSVQRWSEAPSGEALFESIFVFENYPPSTREASVLEVREMDFIEQSNYPLAVLVEPGDETAVTLVFDRARFDDGWIAKLGDRFRNLLEQFGNGVELRLNQFELTSPEEREQLKTWGAGVSISDPRAGEDLRIHDLIAQAAESRADGVAVVCGDHSMTYVELDRSARRVARRLRRIGIGADRLVGLFLPRSIDMIVGMLGILKAGGAYVPLDPAYPAAHIRTLVEGDEITTVLTTQALRGELPDRVTVVCVDDEAGNDGDADPLSDAETTADHLAYIIHTSGSTGRPKGVMVTHRNLVQSTLARFEYYGDPVGRFLLLSSFAFDSSVAGIFWTLCSGGTLVLPEPGAEQDLERLQELIRRHEVTHLLCLPALYELLLSATDSPRSLAAAIVAGEACPAGLIERHFECLPESELYNEYGPTEGTVWCSVHRMEPQDAAGPPPIGRPIPGARIYVLDHHGRQAAPGTAGELCVAGPGVAQGYLGRDDLTAERFVSIDVDGRRERIYRTGDLALYREDGALLFLGRADAQLKIRGHRIETGVVEEALRAHEVVQEAAVAGRASVGRTGKRLVGYVEVAEEFDSGRLRAELDERLPEFMVPDVIVQMERLPRRPNGKIDYRALPDPGERVPLEGRAKISPRNEAERILAEIWSTLLGVDEVGVEDNYFELGGDSIISIQMVSRARQAGVQLEPGQVAEFPTIAGLAAAARVADAPGGEQESVAGDVPLGPIQRWFFESDPPAPDHWNQSNLFEVPSDVDEEALDGALRDCLQHHDMLRARFVQEEAEWRQIVEPWADRRVLEVVDVADEAETDRAVARAQAGLDLSAGKMVRALLLRRADDSPRRLLIAVHHLVTDVVSWVVLMEDLETAYLARTAASDVVLPPRTTPYRDWIERLREMDWSDEAAYWSAPIAPADLPTDFGNDLSGGRAPGVEGDVETVRRELAAEVTARLTAEANSAYRTRTEELLVTALSQVVNEWTGGDTLRLELEGHGRLDGVEGVDLSRTVGWLTATYPVTIQAAADASPESAIKAVKEHLRAVPRNGLGYGVLRFLLGHSELARQPAPPVLFNFLGRARTAAGGAFRWVSSEERSSRNPNNPRGHALEVVAAVRDGRLTLDWHYSRKLHRRETIERLGDEFLRGLERIVEHCCGEGVGGLTPSDFPEAGLDQEELDRLTAQLADTEGLEAILPLLPLQRALLLSRDLDPKVDPGFLQVRCALTGDLDAVLLERAWTVVVGRHPALRTAVQPMDGRDPVVVVRRDVTTPWTHEDWRGRSEQQQGDDLHRRLEEDRRRGVDPESCPAMRAALLRTGERRYELIWTCHHLFLDGWSSALVLDDWMDVYEALRSEQAIPPSPSPQAFRAWYAWNASRDPAAAESYWRERLDGYGGAPYLRLGDRAGEVREFAAETHSFSSAPAESIRETGARLQLTANAFVQGAWAIVLSRLVGDSDVVFGTTVAGRSASVESMDRLAGLFANVVPIRSRVDRSLSVGDWLRTLRDEQFEMQAHEDATLGEIQDWSGIPGSRALFDSFVVVENFPTRISGTGGESIALSDFRSDLTTVYPLTIAVVTGELWSVECRYDRSRCDPDSVRAVLAQFETTLHALATDPDQSVGTVIDAVDLGAVDVRITPPSEDESPQEGYVPPRDEIELRLGKILEETLGVSQVGAHDDYFALGGTSIGAVRLFAQIENEFGRRLPLSTLLSGSTLADLAEAVRGSEADAGGWKSLTPIQAGGSQPPIACVHAGGSHVLFYRDLARRLGPDQPVYGLEPVGLDGCEPPLDSIQEMARLYADELRAVQPEGPYRLVGYCVGGAVCLEMARHLEKQGQRVDLLLMVDSGLPWELARVVTLDAQIKQVWRDSGPLGIAEAIVRRSRQWIEQKWALRFGGPDSRRRAHQDLVEEACRRAFGQYHAEGVVDAPITLIRSSEYVREEEKIRHLDWGKHTSEFDVHVVEAGHDTILLEPEVEHVAEVIHRRLGKAT